MYIRIAIAIHYVAKMKDHSYKSLGEKFLFIQRSFIQQRLKYFKIPSFFTPSSEYHALFSMILICQNLEGDSSAIWFSKSNIVASNLLCFRRFLVLVCTRLFVYILSSIEFPIPFLPFFSPKIDFFNNWETGMRLWFDGNLISHISANISV